MMMRPEAYHLILLGIGLAVAIVEVVAAMMGGRRYLWISSISLVIAFSLLGYWRSQSAEVTPLITYLLQASLPAVASAVAIDWLTRQETSRVFQVLCAFSVWYVSAFLLVFTVFFF